MAILISMRIEKLNRLKESTMRLIGNGFATEVPAGWQDRSMVTLIGPTSATGFAANVVVVREDIGPRRSVEEYASRQRQAMESQIDGLEILDERPARINGAAAYQRLQRFASQGHRVQQAQTFILADGIVFAVTCTASLEDFDKHLDAFRRVVDSFQCFDPRTVAL